MNKTFEEIKALPVGTILYDKFEDGLRFILLRGPAAICAYVGIPEGHPLAGHDYDDVPVWAHGGLTYAGVGDGCRPKGYYWYGWDYGHCNDKSFFDYKFATDGKEWLVDDVVEDSWGTLSDFKSLIRFSEAIFNKAYAPEINHETTSSKGSVNNLEGAK